MDATVVGIAITAGLGAAGILSTHVLARSQRKAERDERYMFAAHEFRSSLYSDYVAELRMLGVAARLRESIKDRDDNPPLDMIPLIRRLTELSARIKLVSGQGMADAAQETYELALSFLLELDAAEKNDFADEAPSLELHLAVNGVEREAMFELSLIPLGDAKTIKAVRAMMDEEKEWLRSKDPASD